MHDTEDTEVLLALLSSLLDDPPNDSASLLDALVQADGDVERAAARLNNKKKGESSKKTPPDSVGKIATGVKRKRKQGLEGWLVPNEQNDSDASPSPKKKAHSKRAASPNDHDFIQGSSKPTPDASPIKPVKPVSQTEFLNLLRPPTSTKESASKPPKYPPLTLATPELIAKHVPCTMHLSVLPPELACRLYYAMIDHSESWQRNKWWLFDRVVESPHRTSFFVRKSTMTQEKDAQEAAQFWYNGRPTPPPDYFPPEMEEACEYVERIVNAELRKRERYPLEWGGEPVPLDGPSSSTSVSGEDEGAKIGEEEGEAGKEKEKGKEEGQEWVGEGEKEKRKEKENVIWRANVAASNRYEGGSESVGFHSDQLTYLGPYPTIASLSLGTTRIFRLREVVPTDEKDKRSARTYNIPLPNNSLTIMHASCQERFKHSIPPQTVIEPFHPSFPRPLPSSSTSSSTDTRYLPEDLGLTPAYNARINITFRFYRPDFRPSSIPRCLCGVPCILRPDMKNRYDEESLPSKPNGKSEETGKGEVTRKEKEKEEALGEEEVRAKEKEEGEEKSKQKEKEKRSLVQKYWWTCYAGAQNDGKGCKMWKVMDVKAEGRGPFVGDI